VLPDFVENTLRQFNNQAPRSSRMTHHVIPGCHNRLHIEITREEGYYAIGDNLTIFHKDASEIPNDRWIIPNLEPRADGNLITAAGDDLFKRFRTRWSDEII